MTSATTTTHWVTGLFHDRASAERAVDAILKAGHRPEDVSMVMSDSARAKHFGTTTTTTTTSTKPAVPDASLNDPERKGRLAEGVGVGGLVGGSVGAVVAGIAAVGTSLLLPGLGLVVAGPIAAALAGAGAGGATGSLIGGLANAGVSETHAKHYEGGLKKGGILVAVDAKDAAKAEELRRWFREAGADEVQKG